MSERLALWAFEILIEDNAVVTHWAVERQDKSVASGETPGALPDALLEAYAALDIRFPFDPQQRTASELSFAELEEPDWAAMGDLAGDEGWSPGYATEMDEMNANEADDYRHEGDFE